MKELLRTTDPLQIVYARHSLETEGIAAFELDVNMSMLEGAIGIFPRRLMVADRDWFRAQAILRDLGILG